MAIKSQAFGHFSCSWHFLFRGSLSKKLSHPSWCHACIPSSTIMNQQNQEYACWQTEGIPWDIHHSSQSGLFCARRLIFGWTFVPSQKLLELNPDKVCQREALARKRIWSAFPCYAFRFLPFLKHFRSLNMFLGRVGGDKEMKNQSNNMKQSG